MKIALRVSSCRECPNRRYYSGGRYNCAAVDAPLPEDMGYPDWCPLPNDPAPMPDEALRLAVERTRDDLGTTGDNYPAVQEPKVTDAPETIWLVYGDLEHDDTHLNCYRDGDVGWCDEAQYPADVRYVRADIADAAVAAALERRREYDDSLLAAERGAQQADFARRLLAAHLD